MREFSRLCLWLLVPVCLACNHTEKSSSHAAHLPYLGQHEVQPGSTDTAYYTIPAFVFINQDSATISHRQYEGKVYVADFFFTTCPTICPAMSAQMVRLQALIERDNLSDRVALLSHTVDPTHDTPAVLKEYAGRIGAHTANWNFVTGEAAEIYRQAQQGYFLTAMPSDTAAGGFFHSEQFALVDAHRHLRGIYDGTSTKDVDRLFNDITHLVTSK